MQPPSKVLILSPYRVSGKALRHYLSEKRSLDRQKYDVAFRSCASSLEMVSTEKIRPAAVIFIGLDRIHLEVSSLRALFPFSRLLVIACDVSEGVQADWLSQGIGGVIDEKKTDDLSQLEKALDTVLKGELWASRRVLSRCIRSPAKANGNKPDLTRREQELIGLLRLGLTNNTIAERLHISQKTVKGHLTNIYRKLDVDNRLQAVLKSQQLKQLS